MEKSFYKSFILDEFSPVAIYQKIKKIYPDEISFLFESSVNTAEGNFSYIFLGQRQRIWHKDSVTFFQDEDGVKKRVDVNPLAFLKSFYEKIDSKPYKDLGQKLGLGFTDGFVGNISYDIICEFEPILKKSMQNLEDELKLPDLDLLRPNIILGFSHKTSKLTLLTFKKSLAGELLKIKQELLRPYECHQLKKAKLFGDGSFHFKKEEFFELIKKSKEKIRTGDVFQVLISNRFTQKARLDALSFYRVLRSKNPSPYLFLLEYEKYCLAGSSPELMVKLENNKIILRPIAGTRKRGKDYTKDKFYEKELINDEKEKSEHIMLVDLGRNDLGKVAKTASIKLNKLMSVEKYSHVMHLVSELEAVLDEKYDMFDLFTACFSAGTMTGAPKIRAMELIAEFEKQKRNFYSGCVAYFGFDGNMDTAITIRTSYIDEEKIVFQAGAGIVANSEAKLEYLEVQNKLAANISALEDLTKID